MQQAMAKIWQEECYVIINTLQVSKAKLPNNYENALTATQIASQNAITAKQNQQNTIIDMNTKIS